MAKRPDLMITTGDLAGRRFSVGSGGLRLGRSSSNDIHIPDEELSRNHCLFELVGEEGLRLTDLASANGTYLNGRLLDGDPAELHVGDIIEVGSASLRVVGDLNEPLSSGAVDLGLGDAPLPSAPVKRRSLLTNILWGLTFVLAVAAIYLVLMTPANETMVAPIQATEEVPVLKEVFYEKVEANAEGVFRYELILSPDGVLSVSVDDVPKENRHLTKRCPLDERAMEELGDILSWKALREIDREYAGVEPDPPALNSWTLKTVYSTRVRSVSIVNTQEPVAFRAVRERLEAFSKNQLGIWALQYSRDKLIALAEESVTLGQSKWADRDVQYGNLFGAVKAFGEALFYLETVNPKPECFQEAQRGLEEAKNEMDRRYSDQRFAADRAINLGQWEIAQRELGILLEMVPERRDDRNREAAAKLIDVEKRMRGGKTR